MTDIVVVGSHAPGLFMRVQRAPLPGETVLGWDFQEPVDGGKGSNQAIAAARLGAYTRFIGCVGRDRIGDQGEAWMRDAGVDTRGLIRSENSGSGVGFILLDQAGIPAMVTSMGANKDLTETNVSAAFDQIEGAAVLLTQFEIPLSVALHAATLARARGWKVIVNPAPAVELSLAELAVASILTPNESEARSLLGLPSDDSTPPATLAAMLLARTGCQCVIVTAGEAGAYLALAEAVQHVPALAVTVRDTSGAGDMFCAALAVALAEGCSLPDSARWASGAAALSVTREGTIPAYPTRAELEAFLQAQGDA